MAFFLGIQEFSLLRMCLFYSTIAFDGKLHVLSKKLILTRSPKNNTIYIYQIQFLQLFRIKGLKTMEFTNQLGYIRETIMGISQEQLARKSSISRHTISEIELKKRIPNVYTALKLAAALDCAVEDIFILKS